MKNNKILIDELTGKILNVVFENRSLAVIKSAIDAQIGTDPETGQVKLHIECLLDNSFELLFVKSLEAYKEE